MAISFEPLDVEGVDFRGVDVVAYKARKGRGRSGDIGLGKCFGAIRLLDNNNARIGKDHKASSTPDLLPDFSTTPNLVESVFRAGDGSEKAFYRRADSRLPQAGGGR
ncbi:hypothetical protein N1E27_30075, partial [Pseudomonas aeruginosa]|nr:hypothetical protein [Pseudomonas aeruginosa]MCS9500374.1 hypothetical protein [Pseudomonas aeruginosa]MCS9606138.1 hypothetical protein [Pseudomonas aeruginosa]MCT1299182.1 hypothetical protein [Pseudomonas aeruginosa]